MHNLKGEKIKGKMYEYLASRMIKSESPDNNLK
jgi:hypothetical protein